MEGLHEGAIGAGEVPTVENQTTLFSIEDVELEEFESTGLGDTQDAREDHGAADLNIGRASLDAVFTDIVYGWYKKGPACCAMLEFTIKSTADFKVKMAKIACTVGSETTNRLQISSSDVVRPSVLKIVPRTLDDDNPTAVGITATLDLSPSISVPDGPEISLGSFNKQKAYTEVYGWHLYSSVTSSDGQKATTRDCATWTFTANKMQKDSKLHVFSIEVLIRHPEQPFYADFEIEATLGFSASLRTIGKKKIIKTRRRFSPFRTAILFSN